MSEISIIIPLDALPDGTPMTAGELIPALLDGEKHRAAAKFYKAAYNNMAAQFRSAGNSLQLILDEVDSEFERVQALRKFATELKEQGALTPDRP